jgi:hypothetical protein
MRDFLKVVVVVLGSLLFLGILASKLVPNPASAAKPACDPHDADCAVKPVAAKSRSVPAGGVATLRVSGGSNQDVLIAVNKAAFDEVITFSVADDTRGLLNLVIQGRAFFVPSGTRVKVIDPGIFKTRVRVLDGPLAGWDGWVVPEFVT